MTDKKKREVHLRQANEIEDELAKELIVSRLEQQFAQEDMVEELKRELKLLDSYKEKLSAIKRYKRLWESSSYGRVLGDSMWHMDQGAADSVYYTFLKAAMIRFEIKVEEETNNGQSVYEPEYQLKWQGQLNHLAELVVELERKGWINQIEVLDRAKLARALATLFDLSQTKRKKDSNSVKSLETMLKGRNEKNARVYPDLPPGDLRRFNNIGINDKKRKQSS